MVLRLFQASFENNSVYRSPPNLLTYPDSRTYNNKTDSHTSHPSHSHTNETQTYIEDTRLVWPKRRFSKKKHI